MKALITGASSGIGLAMANYLNELGVDLILVSRNKERLEDLTKNFQVNVHIIILDLSNLEKIKELYVLTKNEEIDILINNAGFGLFGEFTSINLNQEMEMIDVNIKAVHLLTKLYLKDMVKRNSGYILNVASSAGFGPGPLMATYYATKAYVLNLTEAISYELKAKNKDVSISALCPGPVKTNFNKIANVEFKGASLTSDYVAKYAISKMFLKKKIIIPGFKMKLITFLRRFVPRSLVLKITYNFQKKKS